MSVVPITKDLPSWLIDHCTRLRTNDSTLTNLNLNVRFLSLEMLQSLLSALQHNNTLLVLNLTSSLVNGTKVVDDDLDLTTMLQHPSLQILHLSHNRLRVPYICIPFTSTNSVLTELNLSYNALGPQFCQPLAHLLVHNTTLQHLNLRSNRIGNVGCHALAMALRNNTTLQTLELEQNEITNVQCMYDAIHQSNVYVIHIGLDPPLDIDTDTTNKTNFDKIKAYCRANKAGRQLLWRIPSPTTQSMWWNLLQNIQNDATVRYIFFQERPELFLHLILPTTSITTVTTGTLTLANRKRKSLDGNKMK